MRERKRGDAQLGFGVVFIQVKVDPASLSGSVQSDVRETALAFGLDFKDDFTYLCLKHCATVYIR